ncbi:MAG: glycine cleavage system aminomethyltransferase GcvT [Verrucomicrobia bacterium]|nr:glycine cleavage system aminomethyltransferase GcvT [Verrucomicrobiota bacterium]
MKSDDRKTPLFETHVALGARMAPFGGFAMPIQYTGIFKEHEATRTGSTLFDTCHMGEFRLSGSSAVADLEALLTCPIGSMQHGQCRYGLLCNESGGVIDDLLIYRIGDHEFMLVVNAGTQENDFEWINTHCSESTTLENRSDTTAKIDIQGPGSPDIMNALIPEGIKDLRFYRFKDATYQGESVLVSRTGYTGEIGFELYAPLHLAAPFWQSAMQQGAVCAGLGARDTLRLEMGMPLYGHELDDKRNAAEAGFSRAISADKPFMGDSVIRDPARHREALVGLQLGGRQSARHGDTILASDGSPIGTVTSGSFAPSLGTAIALGYVTNEYAHIGTETLLQTSRKALTATIVKRPFYTAATAREAIENFCS